MHYYPDKHCIDILKNNPLNGLFLYAHDIKVNFINGDILFLLQNYKMSLSYKNILL